jgi:hypothetical protein
MGVAVAVLVCACLQHAYAEENPEGVMVGANIGGTVGARDDGLLIGAEVSYVKVRSADMVWYGGYVDALYTQGLDTSRDEKHVAQFSAGPEFGYSSLGFDAGIAFRASTVPQLGVRLRPMLTLGIIAFYTGVDLFPASDTSVVRAEIGFLFKFPTTAKLIPRTGAL